MFSISSLNLGAIYNVLFCLYESVNQLDRPIGFLIGGSLGPRALRLDRQVDKATQQSNYIPYPLVTSFTNRNSYQVAAITIYSP